MLRTIESVVAGALVFSLLGDALDYKVYARKPANQTQVAFSVNDIHQLFKEKNRNEVYFAGTDYVWFAEYFRKGIKTESGKVLEEDILRLEGLTYTSDSQVGPMVNWERTYRRDDPLRSLPPNHPLLVRNLKVLIPASLSGL